MRLGSRSGRARSLCSSYRSSRRRSVAGWSGRSPRSRPGSGRRERWSARAQGATTMSDRLAVALESAPKKTFATALDWPGWSRSGKTDELALEALLRYARRYAPIARAAGLEFPKTFSADVVERSDGGSGTEFGVPTRTHELDTRPVDAAEAVRLAAVVEAAWLNFDKVAAQAPAELRKGPRGGGRDRNKIVGHVNES